MRIIIPLLLIFSCSSPNSKSWDEQNTRSLEFNSTEVKRAMELAQENISSFLSHYNENSADSTWSYYVKYGIQNSQTTEHMWINVFQVEPTIKGILDNVPQEVTHVSYLDTIVFSPTLVEDFMIYHGDTLIFGDYLTDAYKLQNGQ
ncbi:MAG: DUF2314 domain-containing protein [Reichenbachiella sp.]|uniref:DUF2314 domain-containing protein n=1 Tax=Reichenbachiella sp. TaxID=2184521 RepID=UPI003265B8D0